MKMYYRLALLLTAFLISGCAGAGLSPEQSQPAPITASPAMPVITAVLTLAPTASTTPAPTASIAMTATVQKTRFPPEAQLNERRFQVLPALPAGETLSGALILDEETDERIGPNLTIWNTYWLHLQSGEQKQITTPGEFAAGFLVTPDRSLVAYSSLFFSLDGEQVIRHELVTMDASGQRLKTLPMDKNWVGRFGWADNQSLNIGLRSTDLAENTLRKPGSYVLVNPLSGEQQIVRPDYPRFLSSDYTVLPGWDSGYGLSYDPARTRVIYPANANNEEYTYALYDLEEQRLLASFEPIFHLSTIQNFYPPPRWSADGSKVVFLGVNTFPHMEKMARFELYSVTREGVVEQLTHLAGVAYIWEGSYVWSPDGQKLALFLGPAEQALYEKPRLAILDTVTHEITDTRIQVAFSPGKRPPALIWSPDGRQIMLTEERALHPPRVLVFDLEQEYVAPLVEGMVLQAWMAPHVE